MQQRKIGKNADLDLQITNAQTKEGSYQNNSTLIPKNTSVIVARVPLQILVTKKLGIRIKAMLIRPKMFQLIFRHQCCS
uniref:DWNN domain-containing protein n=1 Tax=Sarcoptes scabiei TaxID=52283 RepID=A0A834VIY5_SARSC